MSKAEKYLQLEQELQPFVRVMGQASDTIIDQEVSSYPIMIAHQQELAIGLPLVTREQGYRWAIHASTLEEFVTKNIIHNDKVEEFKTNYKVPQKMVCVFVLSELGAEFVFLRRGE